MPILIIVLLAVLVWMFLTYKARNRTHFCRWRENRSRDTPNGRYFVCVTCGIETFSENNLPPQICLKLQGNDAQ
jgi:hypothetical protein